MGNGTYMSLGRTRAGKSRKRPRFLDDDWTDELPPEDPELEDSLDAAEAYAVDGVQERFVGHDVHGGQGSGLSSEARKRLLL